MTSSSVPTGLALTSLESSLSILEGVAPASSALRGDTRERLLDAALDSFARQGFAGTSIRKVCAVVGITPAGLYSHFASKEEIMAAGLARVYLTFLRFLFMDDDGQERPHMLLELARRYMEFQFVHASLAESGNRLVRVAGFYLAPETMNTIHAVRRFFFARVVSAVAEHASNRDIPVERLAEAVIIICDQVAQGPIGGSSNAPDVIPTYLQMIDRLVRG